MLRPDSLASAKAKLLAMVVTPEPPLAPRNTINLPLTFLAGLIAGRRTEARTKASAMVLGAMGWVRNSRAPARMQRTNNSGSVLAE